MKDILYFLMDILDYGISGYLLVYLLRETLEERFQFMHGNITAGLIGLQFTLIQIFLSNSPVVKKFLYGESMFPVSSKPSILCIAVSLGISLLFCLILYKGNRIEIIYLVVTFYALMELIRFALYSFFMHMLDLSLVLHIYFFENLKLIGNKELINAINITEGSWNVTVMAITLVVFYWCLKRYKSFLFGKEHQLQLAEIALLSVSSITGLVLSVLLRCILYYQRGNEIHVLMRDNPEMNLIVPLISILCIVSIMLSARIFSMVVEDNEEKLELEIYKDRIRGMEEHMKDMERLYDGIRGMKHDMKNYISDMEALIVEQNKTLNSNVNELKEYLSGLTNSMDQLDIKYPTGNPVTDVVINRYVRQAEEKHILFQSDFIFPQNMKISAFDLSIILNNALENAVEACEKSELDKNYICMESYKKGNMFFLEIKNSFNGIVKYNEQKSMLDTLKEDTKVHGLGMKNIRKCVEKYYGKAECKVNGKEFELIIMLQGKI